ncbi:hypothetical protein BDV10DRAFT_156048 [Aspergillus recurvatus]
MAKKGDELTSYGAIKRKVPVKAKDAGGKNRRGFEFMGGFLVCPSAGLGSVTVLVS